MAEIEIADLIVLPHGAGALAKFHAQIGPARIYGVELYRELDERGESRGLRIRLPRAVSLTAAARREVKNAAAAAWREAAPE